MLVYPAWHPGKDNYQLIAKKDVFLCATYYKGMEMNGYRPHIMEYEEVPASLCAEIAGQSCSPAEPGKVFDDSERVQH